MSQNNYSKYAAYIIAAIVVIGLIWYFWNASKPKIKTTDDAIKAVTAPTAANVQTNPLENTVPELNPVKKANPFKDIYKNPFSR